MSQNLSMIQSLAIGSIEVLRRLGRDSWTKKGSEGFRTLYERLKRLHLSAHSSDKADDIFSTAWTLVFLEKGKVNFRPFNGKIPGTDVPISIENYTAFLLRNALINESKKQTRGYYMTQDLSSKDDDSDSRDGMDSMYISSSGSAVVEKRKPTRVFREDAEYGDAMLEYLSDYRKQIDRINNGEICVKDSKKAIKSLEDRIAKLNLELDRERGIESSVCRVSVEDFNNNPYSMEEETSFRSLLESFVSSLGDKDDLKVAIYGMLGGLSIDETSKFLEMSAKSLFNELRDAFVEFAQDLEFECCDSVLMDLLRGLGGDCRRINRSKGKSLEVSKSLRNCIKEFSINKCEESRLLHIYFGDEIL